MVDLEAHPRQLGGRNRIVEMDEMEIGRKRKGLHGHSSDIHMDIWGAVDRTTQEFVICRFPKYLPHSKRRRFGPATEEEVVPLVLRYVKKDSNIHSDGLKAYRKLPSEYGYTEQHYVKHTDGEFVRLSPNRRTGRLQKVHSNSVDGLWGRIKNFVRTRYGISKRRLFSHLKEYEWTKWRKDNQLNRILKLIGSGAVEAELQDSGTTDLYEDTQKREVSPRRKLEL
jgi:transposase-like protein